jgi:hypothetical protein
MLTAAKSLLPLLLLLLGPLWRLRLLLQHPPLLRLLQPPPRWQHQLHLCAAAGVQQAF